MAASASFTSLAPQLTLRTTLHPTATRDEALLFLDATAQSNLLLLQFVDDAFVLQSTCWGLFRVCRSMSHFAFLWHHRFAGGSKAASVLCVGDTWPEGLPLPVLDGQQVRIVDRLDVLGILLDRELTLSGVLSALGGRLHDAACDLGRALEANGLGLSWHAEQLPQRAESAALYGCELLAAGADGWPLISRRLNLMHYRAIKALLGMSFLSLGEGGYVRMLLWFGYSWRLSAKVALRIVVTLARLLTLPPTMLLHGAIRAAQTVTGVTWIGAARSVALSLGIVEVPCWEALPDTVRSASEVRLHIQRWRRQAVIPAINVKEGQWRLEALSKLSWCPPADFRPVLALTRSVLWTPTLSKACKTWFLAVLTGQFFFAGWHRGEAHSASEQQCLLCGSHPSSLVSHLTAECQPAALLVCAAGLPPQELFSMPGDVDRFKQRIEALASIMSQFHARRL